MWISTPSAPASLARRAAAAKARASSASSSGASSRGTSWRVGQGMGEGPTMGSPVTALAVWRPAWLSWTTMGRPAWWTAAISRRKASLCRSLASRSMRGLALPWGRMPVCSTVR